MQQGVGRTGYLFVVGIALAILAGPAAADRVTDGLLALYTFEEGTGATVGDASGVSPPLDLAIAEQSNTTVWLPGGGLFVDQETIMTSGRPAGDLIGACAAADAFSIEFWVVPDNTFQGGPMSGSRAPIFTLSGDEASRNVTVEQEAELLVTRLRTSVTGPAGLSVTLDHPSLSLTHFTATRDAAGMLRLYLNGSEAAGQSVAGNLGTWDPSYPLVLANEAAGGADWLGQLHLVAVYGRALGAAEVAQNFAHGPHGTNAAPPMVVVQPADRTVTEPDAAIFDVVVAGSHPIGYQWLRNGSVLPGETGASLSVGRTTLADDGTLFSVVVSNAYGSLTSAEAILSVNPYVPTPVQIVGQPQDRTVTERQAAMFSVSVIGDRPRYYQWRKDEVDIPGAVESYHLLGSTSLDDDGAAFDVVVSNAYNTVTSDVAVLTVEPYVPEPASITAEPGDVAVEERMSATFSVSARGEAPLHFQWRRGGVPLAGQNGSSYTLQSASLADDGALFDVVVSNIANVVTSRTALLSVYPDLPEPPVITVEPDDETVTEPAAASFSVSAAGDAPLYYQWRRAGADIPGATDTLYSLDTTVAAADNGAGFDVVVSNAAGSVTSRTAVLTVEPPPPPPPPVFTLHPADVIVVAPQPVGFTVTAAGDGPITYQWRRDGVPITGAVGLAYVLETTTAAADDGAQFDAVAANPHGSATSHTAVLTVTQPPPPPPPRITLQPTDITVVQPQGAGFVVAAGGTPPMAYQWYRDGSPVPGAIGSALVISPTSGAGDDGARVHVVVSDAAGSVTSRVALLTVIIPNLNAPVVDAVEDRALRVGETVAFAVTASDADGTTPSLSMSAGPPAAAFVDLGNGTGSFTWTPGVPGDAGDHPVEFRASDGRFDGTNGAVIHVTSFVVVRPAAGAVQRLGDRLRVTWSGAWALGAVDIDLYHGGAHAAVLGRAAAAGGADATWVGDLPSGLEPGGAYWVLVADSDNPADYAASGLFGLVRGRLNPTDYDGDGRADPTYFSIAPSTFHIARSSDGVLEQPWGLYTTDRPVAGDFDGDGYADVAVYEANGTWHLARTSAGYAGLQLGGATDIPVARDYDGDGATDMAIFQPHNATWHVSGTQVGYFGLVWGQPGDIPAPGDFDGDGKCDVACFRPSDQTWYIHATQDGDYSVKWGLLPTDQPVPADYDGDGYTDIAVYQQNGTWHLARTLAGYAGLQLGGPGDIPVPADYDGDGADDMAIFQPHNATWHVSGTQSGYFGFIWGSPGDRPVR